MSVRFLPARSIDRSRWDECVAHHHDLPYGLSWWLDAVTAGRWSGLILDDYRLVLPLPTGRSVFWLRWVARAPFTQQCGPFGEYHPGDLQRLLEHLPARIRGLDLPLRHGVPAEEVPPAFRTAERTNLVLDLSPTPDTIRAGYGKTLRKKLRRYPNVFLQPSDADAVVRVYRRSSGEKAGLRPHHFRRMRTLIEAALERHHGNLWQVVDPTDGTLLAAGFFPEYKGRIINLFAGSTPEGYAREGMARLLDAIVSRYAGTDTLLDFEGSDLPGVGNFFRAFGPANRPYLRIRR